MLSAKLKTDTAAKHSELESLMHVKEIFEGNLSLEQYASVLKISYNVHQALENKMIDTLPDDWPAAIGLTASEKTGALKKDLEEINIPLSQQDNATENIYQNEWEATGGLYVMEGAMLGGNVIARKLKNNPATSEASFHYYTLYGPELSARWKQIIQLLDTKVPENEYEHCINGANKTFDFFIQKTKQDK